MQHVFDRSIFLGGESDPQPVWADEADDSGSWPSRAAFKIEFTPEQFQGTGPAALGELPKTEYYGEDGWPVEMPAPCKAVLSETIKRELQVFPWGWRTWDDDDWSAAIRSPDSWTRSRVLGPAAHALAQLMT